MQYHLITNEAASVVFTIGIKVTAFLFLALAALSFLRKREPRWHILVIRAAILSLPLVLLSGWIQPFQLPILASNSRSAIPSPSASIPIDQAEAPAGRFSPAEPGMGNSISNAPHLPATKTQSPIHPLGIAFLIWLAGSAFLLLRKISDLFRLRRSCLANATDDPISGELLERWQEACAEMGVSKKQVPDLLISDSGNRSPFVLPGRKSTLVLPNQFANGTFDQATVRHVLRHEAAHVASGDVKWIPIMRFLSMALWFHPLIWWLEALHLRACEEAADASAARKGGSESYRAALAALALELLPVREKLAASFIRLPSVMGRIQSLASNAAQLPPTRQRAISTFTGILLFGLATGGIGFTETTKSDSSSPRNETKNQQKAVETADEGSPQDTQLKAKKDLEGSRTLEQKLKTIIIPVVKFEETPFREVLAEIEKWSRDLDPEKAGINITLDLKKEPELADVKIKLQLEKVPLIEVLRYSTSLAQCRFEVKPQGIQVSEIALSGDPLYTNAYVIPPSFIGDQKAKDTLESVGVTFPQGASAIYNREKQQLIVRNTESQMELVEAWIESKRESAPPQIVVSVREFPNFAGPFIQIVEPLERDVASKNTRESFLQELSKPPTKVHERMAVLTEVQFQQLLREYGQESEAIHPPDVWVESGHPALLKIDDMRWGVIPTAGPDGMSIEAELFFPSHGQALKDKEPTLSLTVWDGSTVAFLEKEEGKSRAVFVSLKLVFPQGGQ